MEGLLRVTTHHSVGEVGQEIWGLAGNVGNWRLHSVQVCSK